jgi:hypothetical protein
MQEPSPESTHRAVPRTADIHYLKQEGDIEPSPESLMTLAGTKIVTIGGRTLTGHEEGYPDVVPIEIDDTWEEKDEHGKYKKLETLRAFAESNNIIPERDFYLACVAMVEKILSARAKSH